MKPWEKLLVDLWGWSTKGRRRYMAFPIYLVFIIVPAIGGLLESYGKVAAFAIPYIIAPTTELSAEERDLLEKEEWGLVIAGAPSEEKAEVARGQFKKAYLNANHTNIAGQAIWENDILVVRDPRENGRWLVAIDMYPGQSSREAIQGGVAEMIASEVSARVRGQPLERWLNGAAPFKFSLAQFEKTYGRITNVAP